MTKLLRFLLMSALTLSGQLMRSAEAAEELDRQSQALTIYAPISETCTEVDPSSRTENWQNISCTRTVVSDPCSIDKKESKALTVEQKQEFIAYRASIDIDFKGMLYENEPEILEDAFEMYYAYIHFPNSHTTPYNYAFYPNDSLTPYEIGMNFHVSTLMETCISQGKQNLSAEFKGRPRVDTISPQLRFTSKASAKKKSYHEIERKDSIARALAVLKVSHSQLVGPLARDSVPLTDEHIHKERTRPCYQKNRAAKRRSLWETTLPLREVNMRL